MAYRESFEACPRCRAPLEDAGAVRACAQCRGQWVLEPVLAEMVIAMLPPGALGKLTLVPTRGKQTGACPGCGIEMESVSLYGVDLERCPKDHGVWFDSDELQAGLLRSADPANGSSIPDDVPPRIDQPTPRPPPAVSPLPAPEPAPPIAEPMRGTLADVIARMKRGETFTTGYGRAFDTYGWDPQTSSLYCFYQEDTYENPRSSVSEGALSELIARIPHRFA